MQKNNFQSKIFLSQLRAAEEIWKEISLSSEPADRWLGNYFYRNRKKFGSRDRRFLSEITYCLFRKKTFLEVWAKFLKTDFLKTIIILAAFEEKMISSDERDQLLISLGVAMNAAIELSKMEKKQLPPDVCPKSVAEKWALIYSCPQWLVERWICDWGEVKCEAVLKSFEERPPLTLRTNQLKISREKLLNIFETKGLEAESTKHSSWGIRFKERAHIFDTDEFKEGLFEIQDEGSQLVCQWISPEPGDWVWDVCAGGGGKSLALAAMMNNQGRIVATDIRSFKLEDLKKRARRAGAHNIFPAELGRIQNIQRLRTRGFEKIVIDAPCSGTGTLRRNPDAKWKLKPEDFEQLHQKQLSILQNAIKFLGKKGKIYYITCSLDKRENEEVFEEFLKFNPQLKPISLDKDKTTVSLTPIAYNTDGFFLAAAENK